MLNRRKRYGGYFFKGVLHFVIKDAVISKWDYVAVMDCEDWAFIMSSEAFNNDFGNLTIQIH